MTVTAIQRDITEKVSRDFDVRAINKICGLDTDLQLIVEELGDFEQGESGIWLQANAPEKRTAEFLPTNGSERRYFMDERIPPELLSRYHIFRVNPQSYRQQAIETAQTLSEAERLVAPILYWTNELNRLGPKRSTGEWRTYMKTLS